MMNKAENPDSNSDSKKTGASVDMDIQKELYKKYAGGGPRFAGMRNTAYFLFKKYSWIIVLKSAFFFKRVLDITVSAIMLVLLAPLFLATALAIKLQYIESQSLRTDLLILLKTVPAVMLGKGAY